MFSHYLHTNFFASHVGDEMVNVAGEAGIHVLWDKNSILWHMPLFDFLRGIWKECFHASTSVPWVRQECVFLCLFLILSFMWSHIAMRYMLSVSIYLKIRLSTFKGFQNTCFHGVCILGTFYLHLVNATLGFHALGKPQLQHCLRSSQ